MIFDRIRDWRGLFLSLVGFASIWFLPICISLQFRPVYPCILIIHCFLSLSLCRLHVSECFLPASINPHKLNLSSSSSYFSLRFLTQIFLISSSYFLFYCSFSDFSVLFLLFLLVFVCLLVSLFSFCVLVCSFVCIDVDSFGWNKKQNAWHRIFVQFRAENKHKHKQTNTRY